jgi:hypothetical protein
MCETLANAEYYVASYKPQLKLGSLQKRESFLESPSLGSDGGIEDHQERPICRPTVRVEKASDD